MNQSVTNLTLNRRTMLTVGEKFPDLHMKGVNEENEYH